MSYGNVGTIISFALFIVLTSMERRRMGEC